eukprot:g350.t1
MFSKLFYFVAVTLSVVYAAETTGVAYVRNVASDDYNSLTMKVVLTGNSNNVDFTVDGSPTVTETAGKYELCMYPYGGYDRDYTLGTKEQCVGGILDNSGLANFGGTTPSVSGTLTTGSANSLVGKALALEKRSIAVMVQLDQTKSAAFEVQLQSSSGSMISTTSSTSFSDNATKVLSFNTSNPTGTYKLVVTSNTDTEGLIIGEYTGGDNYWKTYMLTTHVDAQTGSPFDDFPALGEEYTNYVANGWTFPTAASYVNTPEYDVPASVLEIAAVGAIGLKDPSSAPQQAGGKDSTGKIICSFDDKWGSNRMIFGSALLSYNTAQSRFRFQTDISGLQCSTVGVTACNHSFHFHAYGDVSGGNGASEISPTTLGSIVSTYDLGTLALSGSSSVIMTNKYINSAAGDFESVIGMSLTVHDGPTSSSETVAWGVCGVAPANACMRYGCSDVEYEVPVEDGASGRASSLASWLLVLVALVPLCNIF